MAQSYNINELLEKKKELESQISEVKNYTTTQNLTYKKETYTDFTQKNSKPKVIEPREKLTLNKYSEKFMSLVSELAKTKTAIAQFNALHTAELLYKREKARLSIDFLKMLKTNLPKENQEFRKVLRQNSEGVSLEIVDVEVKPMFSIEDVEKYLNETAAEERKLNTQIQKINLDAKISFK